MAENAINCGQVRRYYLGDEFLRFLFGLLPRRAVVLCSASEPVGRYQQCRPRLNADSLDDLRARVAAWLDAAFAGLSYDEVPPVYPSLHYAVGRYWQGGRDWVIEADENEGQGWQDAWSAMEPIVGLCEALQVPYSLRYTGHCSPHLCVADEHLPKPEGLKDALTLSEDVAREVEERLRTLAARHSSANVHLAGPIARLPYTLNENTGYACIEIHRAEYGAFEPSRARLDQVRIRSQWPPGERSERAVHLIEWAKDPHAARPEPVLLFSRTSTMPMPPIVHSQTNFTDELKQVRERLRSALSERSCPGPRVCRAPQGMAYVPAGQFISCASWPSVGEATAVLRLGEPLMSIEETGEYFIDISPVTSAQYAEFIEDCGYGRRELWSDEGWGFVQAFEWCGPSGSLSEAERGDLPVRGVSYLEAEAYARWAGKRLPTLAEWEKACRGVDGRRWPWGDEFDEARCNTADRHASDEDWALTPIGIFPAGASPYGCLDMVGNVWEWTQEAMTVGGSSVSHMRDSHGCQYHGQEPHYRRNKVGFRCAKTPGR